MVDNIRRKYEALHVFQDKTPENFVSQLAFTQLNTFLLTTDGRLFSWGSVTPCLGREIGSENLKNDQERKA
jgi:alpha-tubulin suppressor-like RCC1 family protein